MIYVMHEGKVVEQGSHRILLAKEGRYARLWRAQAGDVVETRFRTRGKDSEVTGKETLLSIAFRKFRKKVDVE